MYSPSAEKWISIEHNKNLKESIFEIKIPNNKLRTIMTSLNSLGVNSQTLFPDIGGVCTYINWLAENRKLNH
jgi:hypothetical protein